jgi:hypothetical protein
MSFDGSRNLQLNKIRVCQNLTLLDGSAIVAPYTTIKKQYYSSQTGELIDEIISNNSTDETLAATINFTTLAVDIPSRIVVHCFVKWYSGGFSNDLFQISLKTDTGFELDSTNPYYIGEVGGGAREPMKPLIGCIPIGSNKNETKIFELRFKQLSADDESYIDKSKTKFIVEQITTE